MPSEKGIRKKPLKPLKGCGIVKSAVHHVLNPLLLPIVCRKENMYKESSLVFAFGEVDGRVNGGINIQAAFLVLCFSINIQIHLERKEKNKRRLTQVDQRVAIGGVAVAAVVAGRVAIAGLVSVAGRVAVAVAIASGVAVAVALGAVAVQGRIGRAGGEEVAEVVEEVALGEGNGGRGGSGGDGGSEGHEGSGEDGLRKHSCGVVWFGGGDW